MASGNLTLRESIEKAGEELNVSLTKEGQEENVSGEENTGNKEGASGEEGEKGGDPEKPVKKETPKSEEPSEEEKEIENALALLRALQGPDGKETAKTIALRLGVLESPKQELTPKQEKDLKTLIAEELGEEYPELSGKLERLLGAIEENSKKEIKTLKEELAERDRKAAEREYNNEYSAFLKANDVTEEVAGLMAKEIRDLPPSGNISLTAYLTKIHKIVLSDNKEIREKLETSRKRQENRKESVKNLSSDVNEENLNKGSRLPSLQESIAAAMRGETLDN